MLLEMGNVEAEVDHIEITLLQYTRNFPSWRHWCMYSKECSQHCYANKVFAQKGNRKGI